MCNLSIDKSAGRWQLPRPVLLYHKSTEKSSPKSLTMCTNFNLPNCATGRSRRCRPAFPLHSTYAIFRTYAHIWLTFAHSHIAPAQHHMAQSPFQLDNKNFYKVKSTPTPYRRPRHIHDLTLPKIFLSNLDNPIEQNLIYKKTLFLT